MLKAEDLLAGREEILIKEIPSEDSTSIVYFHDTNGRNEHCDVPGGIEHHGLKVEYLKTLNGMAKYVHNKNISDNANYKATVPKSNVRKSKKTNTA